MSWAGSRSKLIKYWAHAYLNPTPSEAALEPAIAALGIPYRAQYPFFKLKHYADFALPTRKIIIEVDGKSHLTNKQRLKDIRDTLGLEAMGWKILRCTNEEAQAHPTETVARLLAQAHRVTPLEPAAAALEIARLEALLPPKKPRRARRAKPFPKRPPLPL